jgi:alkylation response protein AidB-like acyl-CoA dehydrogenase
MTVTASEPASVQSVVDAVHELGPTIERRAGEIDAGRRVPLDLLEQLKAAGCFRVLRPPTHGGLGADLHQALEVFDALARVDGSVAWVVGVGGTSWFDLVELPRATFDEVFSDADVVTAGAFNPTGSVTPVDGGYRVSGRWSFASGCEHADWIYGNCIEGFVDGMPALRTVVFSPDEVVIEDTWHVVGLRGTGSHHFHVDDVLVPAKRTHVPMVDPPAVDATIARVPAPSLFALGVAAIAVGIGRAALDDVVAIAAGKVPLLDGSTLATNPTFQHELAVADTALRAARSLLHEIAGELWAIAEEGSEPTLEVRGRVRAAGAWAADRAVAAADVAYRAAGSHSVFDDSVLQRRWRDLHALVQHFLVRPDTLTSAGAVLTGQDPNLLVF